MTAGGVADAGTLAHVRDCPACSERFAAIAAEWSHGPIVSGADPPPGHDTGAFLDRLAAEAPDRPVPGPPPTLEGLEGAVEVGRGGMGIVYRARDTRLGRDVALKVLTGAAAASPEGRLRAEREARLLSRVDHPNIVRIHAVTEVDGLPAIEMEWIDGLTLDRRAKLAPLPVREAARIVRDLAGAVAAMHAKGIIHRDIKPANVLLARAADGEPALPKLVDFGLARPDDATTVTRASVVVGTPSFMAPEQTGLSPLLGPVGPPTDIHALGALLYWLLSGRAPYDDRTTLAALHRSAAGNAPPLSALVPRLPADLVTIAATALEHRPQRRYASAAALAEDLDRFLDGRPIRARRAGPAERVTKWARRRPVAAALAACAVLGTIASLVGVAIHVRSLRAAHAAMAANRDEALAAAALARQSFARLIDDSAERLLARGSALDDADRDHLRQIREQYRSWPLEPDAVSALRFRIDGLRRLMEIFLRLAWTDDAIESARGAIAGLADLESRGEATSADEALRCDLESYEGGLLLAAGRLDEAAAVAEAAVARVAARGAEGARHLPGMLSMLAIAEGRRGHDAEAAREFGRAVGLCDDLLAAAPGDVGVLRAVLPVYFNAASAPAFAADADSRFALHAKVVSLAEDALGRSVADREFLGSSALVGLTSMAEIDLARGRPAEALVTVRRRERLARRLAAENPGVETFTGDSMLVARQAYDCLEALGRPGDATDELEEAVRRAERAVAAEPALVSRARVLAWLLESRAEMELATGRREAAIATWRHLLDFLLPWSVREPVSPEIGEKVAAARAALERLAGGERPDQAAP